MPSDREGDVGNHDLAANQGDLPEAMIERAGGGMSDRGGQAGPGVGGSGVRVQGDDDRGPLAPRDDERKRK